MTTRFRQVTIILISVMLCGIMTACGMGRNEYRYEGWPRDQAIGPDEFNQELIDTCGLTPADIMMIDLLSRRFRDTFTGDTCFQIKAGLPGYRDTVGNQLSSMASNPAVTTNLPTTQGLQYALFSVTPPDTHIPQQVFIDFHESTVAFGERILASIRNATVTSLSGAQIEEVLTGLQPLTGWAQPWTLTTPTSDDIGGFRVMVIDAEGVLYRWHGLPGTADLPRTLPPDFMTVYDAFMALTTT